jgi:glycosyltransferase involved in cell wall biosynthesis
LRLTGLFPAGQSSAVNVDIVIPVYNEEQDLLLSVGKLSAFLKDITVFNSRIVIVDNASTDRTWQIAQDLERQHPEVHALHIPWKGRGLALRTAWSQSQADIVSYMDVDLSTNLKFFSLLVQGISIGYDIAIGSRLLQAAQTRRSRKREAISRSYNLLVKLLFFNRFSDAQCGFKAVRRSVAMQLLPHIENNHWFFDTELLLLAEKHGFRIFEVPVEWIEDLDTRVRILPTVLEDLGGLLRMRLRRGKQRLAKQPDA